MTKAALIILSTGICCCCYFASCKKEAIKGQSPIAVAGRDTIVDLPQENGFILDGSASYDPEGIIKNYYWSKISGPSTIEIFQRHSIKPVIKYLSAGEYQFELKVTDESGLISTDTINISVIQFPPGQEILFDDLTWQHYQDYDYVREFVFIHTQKRPDLFNYGPGAVNGNSPNPEVYLKPQPLSPWILVRSIEQFDVGLPDKFYYQIQTNELNIITEPLDLSLVGKNAKIKIRF